MTGNGVGENETTNLEHKGMREGIQKSACHLRSPANK